MTLSQSVFAMKTSDGNVKVIFEGKHYLKNNRTDDIYLAAQEVRNNPSEKNKEYLRNLLNPNHRETLDGPLEKDGLGNLYLEGFSQPLDQGMGELLQNHLDMDLDIDPFIKFWKRLQLNPNSKARADFLKYIRDFGVTITDEGYAMLYKAVNENPNAEMDPQLVQFVGQEYLKHQITTSGPNPSDVFVVQEEDGYAVVKREALQEALPEPPEDVGEILQQAYQEGIIESFRVLSKYNEYEVTDNDGLVKRVNSTSHPVLVQIQETLVEAHSTEIEHEGRLDELYDIIVNAHDAQFEPSSIAKSNGGEYGMEINLGEMQEMPREKCDPDSRNACSHGLHVGSHKYVSSFGQGRDVILAVPVNPRDIVALPDYDHSKIRTCRYLPYAVMERHEDGTWEEIEVAQVSTDQLNGNFDYEGELQTLQEKEELSDLEKDRQEILESRVHSVE